MASAESFKASDRAESARRPPQQQQPPRRDPPRGRRGERPAGSRGTASGDPSRARFHGPVGKLASTHPHRPRPGAGGPSTSSAPPAAALDWRPLAGQRVLVQLAGGRRLTGRLVGWDALVNMVLDDAVEEGAVPSDSPALRGAAVGAEGWSVAEIYAASARRGGEDASTVAPLHSMEWGEDGRVWRRRLGRAVVRGPAVTSLGPVP